MNRLLGLAALISSLVAMGAWAVDAPTAPAPASLEALMAELQASGGVRTDFVERRTIAILTEPIETRGTLYFAPPDRIARVTTHPGHSTAVVRGMRADIADETGHRSIDLRSSDVAYSVISNIMVLLRGDLPVLRERYEIRYQTDGPNWSLDLEPRDDSLGAVIEHVRVEGTGRTVTEMDTLETNGDATHATFSNVETGLDFDSDAHGTVFRVESSVRSNE